MATALNLNQNGSKPASLEAAILVISRSNIRPLIRQELKAANIDDIINCASADEAIDELQARPQAMLVLEWELGSKSVNKILAAAQGQFRVDTRPIFLLTATVNDRVLAIGADYNVTRVHSGEITRSAIQSQLKAIIDHELDESGIRAALTRVADSRRRGDWDTAKVMLEELHQQFADNRRITCELIANLMHEDQWAEAKPMISDLAAADPQNLRVQHLYARSLMKQGMFSDAAKVLENCKIINPHNVGTLLELGHALLKDDQIKKAMANYADVLDLDGDNREAKRGIGTCKLMTGDVNAALKLLREISSPREIASIFNNAAILAIRADRFHDGVRLYRAALGNDGLRERIQARLVFNLGVAFHRHQRLDDALESFERATQLDSKFAKARHNAVVLAHVLGRDPDIAPRRDGGRDPDPQGGQQVLTDFTEDIEDEQL